jgi:predicted small secreted protein
MYEKKRSLIFVFFFYLFCSRVLANCQFSNNTGGNGNDIYDSSSAYPYPATEIFGTDFFLFMDD